MSKNLQTSNTDPQQRIADLERQVAKLSQELGESRRTLAGFVEHSHSLALIRDIAGRILFANQMYCDLIVGLPQDDVIGKTIEELHMPETAAIIRAHHQYVVETGRMFRDAERIAIHGEQRVFWSTRFPLKDERGTVYAVGNIATDQTEQERTSQSLREREQSYRTLFENATIGVFRTTMDGRVLAGNPALARMLGYDSPEHLIETVTDISTQLLVYPESRTELLRRVEESDYQAQVELLYKRLDNSQFMAHLTIWAVRDQDGQIKHLEGFIEDITERKQAEAERELLQSQIISAQQAALRELATPLMPLADNLIAMPIVGSIDEWRAQQITETLLEGIATYQAEMAILDITGVTVLDTNVANALVRTAQAVQLLGAQVILTGIGAAMAQTLIALGANMDNIVTRSTLQSGIAYALEYTR